jgi:hypothetical protein
VLGKVTRNKEVMMYTRPPAAATDIAVWLDFGRRKRDTPNVMAALVVDEPGDDVRRDAETMRDEVTGFLEFMARAA